jgi:hypothetical protein
MVCPEPAAGVEFLRATRSVGSHAVGTLIVPASAMGLNVFVLKSPMKPELGAIAFITTSPHHHITKSPHAHGVRLREGR